MGGQTPYAPKARCKALCSIFDGKDREGWARNFMPWRQAKKYPDMVSLRGLIKIRGRNPCRVSETLSPSLFFLVVNKALCLLNVSFRNRNGNPRTFVE